jgi:ankyrin repeat protein
MAESPLSPILQALYRGEREEAERLRRQHSDTDVFDAAALGDVERLAEHLDVDPEAVQARSVDGFTPLHYAAYFGGPEATRFLIENGADVEAPSRNMEFAPEARPLHSAVAAGNRDAALVLLEAGADPNARQHGGFTPLMAAEQSGDAALAEMLIRYGARADGGAPEER